MENLDDLSLDLDEVEALDLSEDLVDPDEAAEAEPTMACRTTASLRTMTGMNDTMWT